MRLKNRTKASAGTGAGRAGQRREGGKVPVSRGPWYHPRRDASRQCALSLQHPRSRPRPQCSHVPGAETPARGGEREGWTGPPPELTAPPPRSQRVRRRPAAVPERRHLRAEPALRLPARLHRRALRAAPLRPRRRRRRPGLRPRARGRPVPRHAARLPAAAAAGHLPGLLRPAEKPRPGVGGGGPCAPPRPAPRARRAGSPGAGVGGPAARRVRPELLPGATQQSPPAPSPPKWHLPPPRRCSRGCCVVAAPAARDFGLSFSFILPTDPFLFFFFLAGGETGAWEKLLIPTAPGPASCFPLPPHPTPTHTTVADTPCACPWLTISQRTRKSSCLHL